MIFGWNREEYYFSDSERRNWRRALLTPGNFFILNFKCKTNDRQILNLPVRQLEDQIFGRPIGQFLGCRTIYSADRHFCSTVRVRRQLLIYVGENALKAKEAHFRFLKSCCLWKEEKIEPARIGDVKLNLAGDIRSVTADLLEMTSSSDELASELAPKSKDLANWPSRGESKSAVEFSAELFNWWSSSERNF